APGELNFEWESLGQEWETTQASAERDTVRSSIAAGQRDASALADLVFFRRHPERRGRRRAVQRSQLSPICNSFQVLDATGVADDSAGRKSLNLCEATESMGGRLEVLEVLGAVSGAARHNP